jgi:hypothetical protein
MILNSGSMKHCPKCDRALPMSSEHFGRDHTTPSGWSVYCKECRRRWHHEHKNDQGFRENKRLYDKRYRTLVHPHLLHYYGITFDDYIVMLVSQNGVCAICGKSESAVNQYGIKRLAVDHDHITKRVRGLLCSKCNRALVLLNDDIGRMLRAISYLSKG